LYDQNQAIASARDQASQSAQQLAQQNQSLKQDLDVASKRLDNFSSERSKMQQQIVKLMNDSNYRSPLSAESTRRFEELAGKYPDFDFDPNTGVSKFTSDILFTSGSADLRSSANPLLKDFAQIMNEGDAGQLNILVVGHTDDKRISKKSTAAKHPTNWHLSTNRANSVVLSLAKAGLQEGRMGVAGYSMHQPLVPNKDDKSRGQNRRVEIYVLAPDAIVAGWDPQDTRRN